MGDIVASHCGIQAQTKPSMKKTNRLLKVTALTCLGALIPGLLNAAVIKQEFHYNARGRLDRKSVV